MDIPLSEVHKEGPIQALVADRSADDVAPPVRRSSMGPTIVLPPSCI
jgi:hypothetical protein